MELLMLGIGIAMPPCWSR
ncbi:hypothetical protein [Shewanella dokdonensis]